MNKIVITKIADEILSHKGFDQRGCYGCMCNDTCCASGADVDRETYDMIMAHRQAIEQVLQISLDVCFEKEWLGQTDFLGENAISTTIRNGICALHLPNGRGCALFYLAMRDNLPRRLIPSTCRLYPLTWQNGELALFNGIAPSCNCLDTENCGVKTLWETQQEAIEDILLIEQHREETPATC